MTFAEEMRLPQTTIKVSDRARSIAARFILIGAYTLLSISAAWIAFKWIDHHVKTNPVPSAFGLEYLPGFIPFLIVLLAFPATPVLTYMAGRRIMPESGINLVSIPILAIGLAAYCFSLFIAASFFAWYRQAI